MKISSFLTSSIGRKLIMSLSGIFLILFLLVHLIGNLQLLKDDGGEAFNFYAHFMGSNPLIKTLSIGNFFFFFLHIYTGLALAFKNTKARGGQSYAVSTKDSKSSWASRKMTLLGSIMLIFLVMHLSGFWFRAKFGDLPMDTTLNVKDLYTVAFEAFHQWWIVLIYVFSMLVMGFHLWHGFASAFQTLGINHKSYTPFIKKLGAIYAWGVAIGYAIIPILIYCK